MAVEPAGAPDCWGRQYDEDDDECKNGCDYSATCRPATINNVSRRTATMFQQPPQAPPQFSLPVIQPQQYAPPRFGPPMMQQPPQQQVGYPRMPPTPPQYQQPQQVQMPAQPHAPPGWNSPIAYLPRPNASIPAWWQYEGETTRARLGKNILLSALSAVFAELLRFLQNWTWPKVLA